MIRLWECSKISCQKGIFQVIKLFGIFILVASLNSCATAWNLLNKSDLKKDIDEVVQTHELNDLDCNMVALDRVATCTFSASPQIINQLISSLDLKKYSPNKDIHEINFETEMPDLVTAHEGCRFISPFDEFIFPFDDLSSPNKFQI